MESKPIEAHDSPELVTSDPTLELLQGEPDGGLNPELTQIIYDLKTALVDPEFSPETLRQLWIDFSLQFEALATQASDEETYIKVQISAILQKGIIFREAGLDLRYLEEFDKADMYALNEGLDRVSTAISAEIDARVSELEHAPEKLILLLRGKISDANRAYLWDLWADEQDYEDLINHTFEALLEEGDDPERILAELGVLEI